jgi:hypothetical protein
MLKSPELAKEHVEEAPWSYVLDTFAHVWEQGEHVSLLGKNGSGKTTLAFQLLAVRKYVVILLTKRHDDLYPMAGRLGYRMLGPNDDRPDPRVEGRVAVHIPSEHLTRQAAAEQADDIRELLGELWAQRGWTVYLDEVASLADNLGLAPELRQFWKEARSSRITLVAGTQRPARVPLEMYDQPRFLFFWRNNSREALKRLADMHGPDPEIVRQIVVQLDRFEVLIVDTITDELVRSRPPKLR